MNFIYCLEMITPAKLHIKILKIANFLGKSLVFPFFFLPL